jgi:hypothetical protein
MGNVSITQLTTGQANVNATEINQLVTPLLNEFNGSIDNTNIKSGANIAWSKVATTGQIVNTSVSASAAIAGSKINPDFGAQTIATTGSVTVGTDLSVDGTLETDALTLNGAAVDAASGLASLGADGRPNKYAVGAPNTTDTNQVTTTGATLTAGVTYVANVDGYVSAQATRSTGTSSLTLTVNSIDVSRQAPSVDGQVAVGCLVGKGMSWIVTATSISINNVIFTPIKAQ